jgi:hypothetical protein
VDRNIIQNLEALANAQFSDGLEMRLKTSLWLIQQDDFIIDPTEGSL